MTFTDILDELGIPYEAGREGWLDLHCCWCNRPYLGYNLAHGYFSCWKCGFHHVNETLAEFSGQNYHKIKGYLNTLDRPISQREPVARKSLVVPLGVRDMLPIHRAYLKRRKLPAGRIERLWGVKGIGLASRLAWRLFIPIHYRGQVVSWTTRAIHDSGARYVSASATEESLPHKKLLYGEDYVRHGIICVEGPIDAWAIGPGAVATLGTGFSTEQVHKISKYPLRVVCFDSERGAQDRAHQLVDQLSGFPGRTLNVKLDAKDAADASPKELKALRKLIGVDA